MFIHILKHKKLPNSISSGLSRFQGHIKVDQVYGFVLKDYGKNLLKSYRDLQEKKLHPADFWS